MKKRRIPLGTVLMLIVLAAVATFNVTFFVASEYYGAKLGNFQEQEAKYKKFAEVDAVINQYFVGEFDKNKAMDSAMEGYIKGLGDQWSGYYDAEQYKIIQENAENAYVGIGVTIGIGEQDMYKITAVSKGGPAEKAGIKVFDRLSAVDDKKTADFPSYNDLVAAVRGKEGTDVKITVQREDAGALDFTIKRGKVFNETVTAQMLPENIGYMSISGFEKNTDTEFIEKLDDLVKKGATSMVFDVRFNPGGGLNELVKILDRVLPEGTVISMSYKDGQTKEYKSDAFKLDMPMTVIVNKYSISAAEFFAASLQEYGVATIVGEHTGGKGFAQSMVPLSDGSVVNISTARYFTPKGNSLAGVGIAPDVELIIPEEEMINLKMGDVTTDVQLQKAIEILKTK